MQSAHMDMEINLLPIQVSLKRRLIEAGFRTTTQVQNVSSVQLSKELQITPREAQAAKAAVADSASAVFGGGLERTDGEHATSKELEGTSALQLLTEASSQLPIITFCKELDQMLGGGVQVGEVTEFCGVPGVGKTQLCMQLCVDVQIPATCGGVAGSAVYIDTEGSLMVDRVQQIAKSAVKHVNASTKKRKVAAQMSLEEVLSNIHVFRCLEMADMVSCIQLLPDFIKEHPTVKLVVVDSIAFHFRHSVQDMATRARLLNIVAQALHHVADKCRVAVVVTNQVTTKVEAGDTASRIVPALGETWSHACSNRVILRWQAGDRCAEMVKSASRPHGIAKYTVQTDGIRGYKPPAGAPGKRRERDEDAAGAQTAGGAPAAAGLPIISTAAQVHAQTSL